MGLFGKKKTNDSGLNAFLGVGTEYRGKLDFVGTVRIDGHFEGEISTDGDLVLGRQASIIGTVKVGKLISCGRIQGDVTAKERTKLEKSSVLHGTLSTPNLTMEEGAVLEGGIIMSGGTATAKANVVTADFGGRDAQDDKQNADIPATGTANS